jgi:hypothetical protein
MSLSRLSTYAICVSLLYAASSQAACMNKFVARSERQKQVVTLLTGRLTFQEAQALAQAINNRQAPAVEWVDEKGKTISKGIEMKVVRPMPVGCDGKASGVVLVATFLTMRQPSRTMTVRLDDKTVVEFEQQSD